MREKSAKVIEIKSNIYLLSENLNNNPIVTVKLFTTQNSPVERMLDNNQQNIYLLLHTYLEYYIGIVGP